MARLSGVIEGEYIPSERRDGPRSSRIMHPSVQMFFVDHGGPYRVDVTDIRIDGGTGMKIRFEFPADARQWLTEALESLDTAEANYEARDSTKRRRAKEQRPEAVDAAA